MTGSITALLAAEVRSRRTRLGLTQRDLADMAGVSERFVRFVEQGKPSVQLDSLTALLETLGLELRLATRPSHAALMLMRPANTDEPVAEPEPMP